MSKTVGALILLTAFLVTGCAFQRTDITALSQQQQTYYSELEELMEQNRLYLKEGLEVQAETSRIRRQHLANWELSVRKAEVLLAADRSVKNSQQLLAIVLADIELDEKTTRASTVTDEEAQQMLMLYDGIRGHVAVLKNNNETIIEYLASKDKEFAVRSLDLGSINTAISGVREVQEQLGQIEKRSDEAKKTERERIEKSIDRAQDILLKVFSGKPE